MQAEGKITADAKHGEPKYGNTAQPLITSAQKVAAQKRHFESRESSDNSSQSSIPIDRNLSRRRAGKRRQLNDHRFLLGSDSEDIDYAPKRHADIYSPPVNGSRRTSNAPIRLPTPERKKSDWEGPTQQYHTSSTAQRGREVRRRGVSRHIVPYSTRNSGPRNSANVGSYDGSIDAQPPQDGSQYTGPVDEWTLGKVGYSGFDEDGFPLTKSGKRDGRVRGSWPKERDQHGLLLTRDGKVDGRSLRQKREKEEGEKSRREQEEREKNRREQDEKDKAKATPTAKERLDVPIIGADHSGERAVDSQETLKNGESAKIDGNFEDPRAAESNNSIKVKTEPSSPPDTSINVSNNTSIYRPPLPSHSGNASSPPRTPSNRTTTRPQFRSPHDVINAINSSPSNSSNVPSIPPLLPPAATPTKAHKILMKRIFRSPPKTNPLI